MEWVKKKLESKKARCHEAKRLAPLFIHSSSPVPTGYGIEEPCTLHPVHAHGNGHSLLAARLRAIFMPQRCPSLPLAASTMTATLFGFTIPSCRIHLAVQGDGPRSDVLTLLQLAITTNEFAAWHASGPLEFFLQCSKSADCVRQDVWKEPAWSERCNGVRMGEAGKSISHKDGIKPYVLQLLEPTVLGIGVLREFEDDGVAGDLMYIRAPVLRSRKATEDYERLHLTQLDDLGFHDIAFIFLRE